MTIEKLPSGSYRIKQMYKGKYYSVTTPSKPSKKEATILLAEAMASEQKETHKTGTLEEYANKYIAKCEKDKLSPATIKGYDSIARNTPEEYLKMNLFDFDEKTIQNMVKKYESSGKKNKAPKTVRNFNAFYNSVFAEYRPQMEYSVILPKKVKKTGYEPSTKDIQAILADAKGTRYSIPFQLAVLGLRRGEICALSHDDLSEDNILSITKDLVIDKNNNPIIKETAKTDASNRRILIPKTLADEIRESDEIFDGHLNTLNKALHKTQKKLGMPAFKLHTLRKFAAAYLHKNGFTDSQILAYGGWEEDSNVMKSVYRYNLDPEDSQKDIAVSFDNLI